MEKKIKNLIIFIIVILVLIAGFFAYRFYITQKIQKQVLSSLEDNFEICKIVKDNISIFDKSGEFWLICNRRPLYTTYENGKINIELNGWSFLKNDPDLWAELENCDYYDSKNSQLIFYCPKNFDSENIIAKIYQFNSDTLKMEKVEEKNFLEIIKNDLASIYNFLSGCEINDFYSTESPDYPAALWLNFSCNNDNYLLATDLATVPLQAPILINNNLSCEKRAQTSFEKSFGLKIDDIKTTNENIVDITSGNLYMTYRCSVCPKNENNNSSCQNSDAANYIITTSSQSQAQEQIKEFGKYFIFPPLEKIENVDFIKEIYENVFIYKINNEKFVSIYLEKPTNKIKAFWIKTEGIYR